MSIEPFSLIFITAPLPWAFSMPASARSSAFILSLSRSTTVGPLIVRCSIWGMPSTLRRGCDNGSEAAGHDRALLPRRAVSERHHCSYEQSFVQAPSSGAPPQSAGWRTQDGKGRSKSKRSSGNEDRKTGGWGKVGEV